MGAGTRERLLAAANQSGKDTVRWHEVAIISEAAIRSGGEVTALEVQSRPGRFKTRKLTRLAWRRIFARTRS
ncbi:hypothetical protein [Xylella fastidiosa]|uniref:hypothetical protein n=1 Tax=Xylella fastidiosa TaxID=2371 RepID=UPI0039848508